MILDYVIREEQGMTDELLEAVYTFLDNDMRATMELEGPEYVADNERVWKMLKPLVFSRWPRVDSRSCMG